MVYILRSVIYDGIITGRIDFVLQRLLRHFSVYRKWDHIFEEYTLENNTPEPYAQNTFPYSLKGHIAHVPVLR